MKAGPKGAVDESPLPFRTRLKGSAKFAAFCKKYVRVPKGTGAGGALILRNWQRDLVGSVLDVAPQPRMAGWCLPRGQGKSSLMAAWGLYELMTGGEGAAVIVAAVDERQAGIVFGVAARMVELSPELSSRVQVYKDRLLVPSRGASFVCLPASPAALEGLDYTLAICDEIGRIDREVWEVVALAQGKRERSVLVGIGTPGPNSDNVLADLRAYSLEHPEDTTQVYREFSAAGFEDHPVDCTHCWELANPALDDFLYRDALMTLLPPKMTEATYRRARLCQFVGDNADPFIPATVWDGLNTDVGIPAGASVVLALDGSHSEDTTALLLGTVGRRPHFQPLQVWEKPKDDPDWRVPILEVEQAIRDACRTYVVREIVCDPFRWARTIQVLQGERLPAVEFPWSPSRITPATSDVYSAAVNGEFTHNGDPVFRRHVLGATVREDNRGGLRVDKTSRRRNAEKIDLAACLIMCHSRCVWLARKKTKRTVSFRS